MLAVTREQFPGEVVLVRLVALRRAFDRGAAVVCGTYTLECGGLPPFLRRANGRDQSTRREATMAGKSRPKKSGSRPAAVGKFAYSKKRNVKTPVYNLLDSNAY